MRLAGFYLFALFVLLLPVLFPDSYYVTVLGVSVLFNIILVVALNLFMGYAGQISLGHAGFFAIGAYTSAVLTAKYAWDPWIALLIGLFLTFAFSYVIARPILKLKGHYLAMATLGFGIIIHILLVQADQITGGPDGMSNIPGISVLKWEINSDLRWYFFIAPITLFSIWMSLNIGDSRMGRALKAIHGSETAALVMGVDAQQVKTQIFVFSAIITSIAGSLFAHRQAFVSPDSFSLFFSVELVTMVVLGGLGSTFGAVFGASILTMLPEFLSAFEDFEMMIYGFILMAIMIFLPQGLFVSISRLTTQFMKKMWKPKG
jgi:branched-chain amino acid transport system permease protein